MIKLGDNHTNKALCKKQLDEYTFPVWLPRQEST